MILKNLPKTIATYQGHLHSERKGLQSTQSIPDKEQEENDDKDSFPLSNVSNVRTDDVCYAIVNPQEVNTGYIGLTGQFCKRSSRGNKYILVGYHFDDNYIRGIPIKNRKWSTILEA